MSTKKINVQCESCELSFIWGKMGTIAQETKSQIVLRNCSREVGGWGEVSIIYDFSEGGTCCQAHVLAEPCCYLRGTDVTVNDFSAFLDMRRSKNWAYEIFS